MPCYNPIQGYRALHVGPNGKRPIVFSPRDALPGLENRVDVPCGQCIGCRLEKSRQWAMRCVHEASLYEDNCFITLTYDEENLPQNHSLDKTHFQKFMKRLRKKYNKPKPGIRYFHCGEYGEQNNRPHYHACIFNHDFEDKYPWSQRDGIILHRSEELEKLWGKGFTTVGALTFESAAYVARYCTKKVTGRGADDHYHIADPDTGEVWSIEPEYATMSRRPGIGATWFKQYKTDAYPSDTLVMRGVVMKPPKYYDQLLEKEAPEQLQKIKEKRKHNSKQHKQDQTSRRLLSREKVKEAQFEKLKRGYE